MAERTLDEMTDEYWDLAHAIAQSLVKDGTDVNELGKAIAYLRSIMLQSDASDRFFKYLKTLVSNGRQVSHSGRTLDYYRSLERACSKHLQKTLDASTLLYILSWAARLMRYYKVSPIGEWSEQETSPKSTPAKVATVESERQREIKAAVKAQAIEVGQVLQAQITAIKGKDVTYLILETVKLTVKEPKKADSLAVGQTVEVEVTQLRDDGVPKKVKCVAR
ncbi:MAG: hypothetical protein HC881_17100 [Leptolyngbyaceae cyanobacterium SL_7_1]|nr:hypothetical protein [Leptolyngbyaceae cyanobacterium SL_7_1]